MTRPTLPGGLRLWLVAALMLVCLVGWGLSRGRLPREIRIATAEGGGMYAELGGSLATRLAERLGRPVKVIETHGTVDNRELLVSGGADLAILQAGAVPLDGLGVLAPLYPDVVHVIARRGRGIASMYDLAGRRVLVGVEGSGMRVMSELVLDHFRLTTAVERDVSRPFMAMLKDDAIDAAIVTTGLLNPDLRRLMASGEVELVPILDASALSLRRYFLEPSRVPRGLYHERPPVPPQPVETIATTALLVARDDVPEPLATAAVEALYGHFLHSRYPTLMSAREARDWRLVPLHASARSYHDPYAGVGLLANFMESIAAIKELLFAVGAGVYVLWERRRRKAKDVLLAEVHRQKEELDRLVEKTTAIERTQMQVREPERLKALLDDVTRVKLEGLDLLTHEALRGDHMFTIFLQQCESLSRKLQDKMNAALD